MIVCMTMDYNSYDHALSITKHYEMPYAVSEVGCRRAAKRRLIIYLTFVTGTNKQTQEDIIIFYSKSRQLIHIFFIVGITKSHIVSES